MFLENKLDRTVNAILDRFTINLNYIFILLSMTGLNPVYPIILVVCFTIIFASIAHNSFRYRSREIFIDRQDNSSHITQSILDNSYIAYKICLTATICNTIAIFLVAIGPVYASPFSVEIYSYIYIALAFIIDWLMLYLYSYRLYQWSMKIKVETIINTTVLSFEPSISGFIKTDTISEEEIQIDIENNDIIETNTMCDISLV
jgi:hypothetical protein